MREALVHSGTVDRDLSLVNVLRTSVDDLRLVRVFEEVQAINEQNELVCLHGVVQAELPAQLIVLQLQREKAWVGEFFIPEQLFVLAAPKFYEPTLLEVDSSNDISGVVIDCME